MDKELSILKYFFDDPTGEYHIREIGRLAKINHMTARKYMNKFVKCGLLNKKKTKLYETYIANTKDEKFLNKKRYYNIEMIRESGIIEEIENFYDYPTIILFGSYATATNTKDSDIDIFILTDIQKEFNTEKYKKILKREISIHKFAEKEFNNMKIKNKELINNIINGITLRGKLEVL